MILDRIIEAKRIEIAQAKERSSVQALLDPIGDEEIPSFGGAIKRPQVNIIAEIKYQSPSHGPFLCQIPPEEIARTYAENGAVALSVLTDEQFFGGSLEYLQRVSGCLGEEIPEDESQDSGTPDRLPLLRKDFIIDRYQVAEARSVGSSAFLLIVACLDEDVLGELIAYGAELGLDALVEIHSPRELDMALEVGARIIGVNNRDLRSFVVDINTSFEIAKRMEGEGGHLLVAESGIYEPSQIDELCDAGFCAFLIGSAFMDSPDPGRALRDLLESSSGIKED
jgi:indole-3-glycerol phosphate synthase